MLAILLADLSTEQSSLVEQLYDDLNDYMYKVAFGYLHNEHDSHDAVMEAFIRIVRNINKLEGRPYHEARAYCIKTIKTVSSDFYRNNERRSQLFAFYEERQLTEDAKVFEKYELDDLKDAISHLSEKAQSEISDYFFTGIPIKDIAKDNNIANVTVYKHLEKSLKLLREYLEKGEDD